MKKNRKEKQQGFKSPKRELCVTKKKKMFSFSFVVATTLEEPLLSIIFVDDGCNDKNKECSNKSNILSNIGTIMNNISLIPSLLSHLPQESLTFVSSQCISIFVSIFDCFSRFFLGFSFYIQTKLFLKISSTKCHFHPI